MTLYSTMKTIYKTVLPNTLRKAVYRNTPKPLRAAKAYLIRRLEKTAEYDEIYDEEYYTDGIDSVYRESCEVIAESIVRAFSPKFIVDVGCGAGELLLALKKRGVVCCGLEYSSAALKICRQKGLDVIKFDLLHDTLLKDSNADLVVSTEVAEHLSENYADRFIDILCAIASNVIITAAERATTYVGDHTHLNEQPREYWINKFADKGFKYKEDIVKEFRREWQEREIKPWFLQHLMVFCEEPCDPA